MSARATEPGGQSTTGTREATGRYPCMDGLRALAAAIIITHHVALFTGTGSGVAGDFLDRGDVGLAIFFQVSGFLLYRPFVAAHLRGRAAPDLGAYLTRRFLRIFPGYWFALLGVALVLRTASDWSAKATIARFTFSHVYFTDLLASPDGVRLTGIGQSWSLNVELLFYLFLPAYAWAIRSIATRAGRGAPAGVEFGGVAVLVGGAVTTLFLFYAAGTGDWERFVALPKALLYLGLGMLLAVWSARPAPPRLLAAAAGRPGACWAAAAVLFWFVATQLGLGNLEWGDTVTRASQLTRDLLEDVIAFLLLLPAVFGDQAASGVRRFLRHPVVVWLGTVSYGLYLWHVDLLHRFLSWVAPTGTGPRFALTLAAVGSATVVMAAVSYYAVERPALRLKDRVPLFAGGRPGAGGGRSGRPG